MKFRVERDALADAVAWAARSLSARPTIPVLAGLLLVRRRRSAVGLRLRPRGLHRGRSRGHGRRRGPGAGLRPAARRDHPGAAAAPGRRHGRRVAADDLLRLGPVHPADDAGRGLPDAARRCPPTAGTVDSAEFATAVAQVAIAAGRDDTLPMLTGVRLEIEGDQLTLAATDRYRLAVRELPGRPATRRRRAGPGAGAGAHPGRRGQEPGQQRAVDDRAVGDRRHRRGHHRLLRRDGRPGQPGHHPPARCARSRAYRSLLPTDWASTAEIVGRPARRGGQAGRAGRRAQRPGAAGVRRRQLALTRRRRGRGPRRGAAGGRLRGRADHDGVQPAVPARRARRAAVQSRPGCCSPRRTSRWSSGPTRPAPKAPTTRT